MIPPTMNVDSNKPANANHNVGARLPKNALTFMLKAASNMMGGSSQIEKNSKSKPICCTTVSRPASEAIMAHARPHSTPTPCSGTQ
eukprot:4799849-Prymnesium_polylepis.3